MVGGGGGIREERQGLSELRIRKWEDLNRDCLANIFERVGIETWSLPLVCRNWQTASLDPQCWKELHFKFPYKAVFRPKPKILRFPFRESAKLAVRCSQGTATKVVVQGISRRDFDGVMACISKGCPLLKSLILSEAGNRKLSFVPKFIKKWKHLEHLTIACQESFNEILTEVSINCKKFASLTTSGFIDDEATTAIVTKLQNIKSLNLRYSILDRQNLVRIISECRKLELLDVRDCARFVHDGAKILEMASHIKTFMSEGSVGGSPDSYHDSSDYDYDNYEFDYGCNPVYDFLWDSDDTLFADVNFLG